MLLQCRMASTQAAPAETQAANLLFNGNFESDTNPAADQSPSGWAKLWSRDGVNSSAIDSAVVHGGAHSLRVDAHGKLDWAVASTKPFAVKAGQIFELSGWIKVDKAERAGFSASAFDSAGKAIDWSLGEAATHGTHDWQQITSKLLVPSGCTSLQVRFTGVGSGTAWLDDVSFTARGDISAMQTSLAGKHLGIENQLLSVRFDPAGGTLSVTDRRTNRTWEQKKIERDVVLTDAQVHDNTLRLSLWDIADDLQLTADLTLVPDRPELKLSIDGKGPMTHVLDYPQAFASGEHAWIILPMNEGIMFPASDASVKPTSLVCYGGHGICMPWYGVTDAAADGTGNGGAGMMTIVQSPDDADVFMDRRRGTNLCVYPLWEPTRSQFGYARKLTWVFLDKGGYPAMAERYRDFAQSAGLVKTLAEKQKANPNVDLLIGAANVWNFDMNPVTLCREMKSLGIDRVLWSKGGKPAELEAINALGYLTSRYDIFQDVYPPGKPAWEPHDGWPEDLVLLPDLTPMKGWTTIQKNKDGTQIAYDGGVITSPAQVKRAKVRIPEELKTFPYKCRFIDTTTASPWREDYNPAHPLSRSEDRKYKMELLDYCSNGCNLVIGTETGIDPAVLYVDYFEGMMSLGPYRLPDAGRDTIKYKPPTPDFLKYQVGEFYRIPLWELVYHDCVVADWYWGDYNNKAPEVWDRRDLFNILYSTPPVFMFDKATWTASRDRFVKSCKEICPIVRQLGNAQMLSHEFVTADHAVQRTTWSDGTRITVNFGDKPYSVSASQTVGPMGFVVDGAH
jgi:hypothetical protein